MGVNSLVTGVIPIFYMMATCMAVGSTASIDLVLQGESWYSELTRVEWEDLSTVPDGLRARILECLHPTGGRARMPQQPSSAFDNFNLSPTLPPTDPAAALPQEESFWVRNPSPDRPVDVVVAIEVAPEIARDRPTSPIIARDRARSRPSARGYR